VGEQGGDDEIGILGPGGLGMTVEILAMAVVNEATYGHGVSVVKMHPTLGKGVMGGERDGVGVVKDEAHVEAGQSASQVDPLLVGEPLCISKVNVVSMIRLKFGSFLEGLGPQALLHKGYAEGAFAKASSLGQLYMRKMIFHV
jgi:hypothetical protein